jgi:hypothetical protein
MSLPAVKQPDVQTIASELTAWHAWTAAHRRREAPLPELPPQEDEPSTAAMLIGLIVRCPVIGLGWLAGKARMHSLRQACARLRVRLDWMVLCRAGCSLNEAFTELGLALLQGGDVASAVECLRRSWHVHPCPHNMSFSLSARLWIALAGIPGAEGARGEYATVAGWFAPDFGIPRKKARLSEVARMIYRSIREAKAEHHHAADAHKDARD